MLDEGIDWSWESFGEYLDAVERRPHDIDLCAQLPHGALRLYVMGERAARLEDATEETRRRCAAWPTEAMRAGAVGFSTSRTLNHRTASGDPTPSLRARADELEAIALGVADAGHGVVELISDFWPDTDAEFALVRGMVGPHRRAAARSRWPRATGSPRRGGTCWRGSRRPWRTACPSGRRWRRVASALLVGLQSSFHPFSGFPAFGEIAGRPVAEQARALRDPSFRARLLAEVPRTKRDGGRRSGRRRLIDYARLFPLGDVPDYEPTPEHERGTPGRGARRRPRAR